VALGGVPVTIGASTELAREVDQLQYVIGIGPCLHALATGEGMYVADLAADDRWADYGPRAATLGAKCCVSLPIRTDDDPVGVLKVYGSEVDGLDEWQRELSRGSPTSSAAEWAWLTCWPPGPRNSTTAPPPWTVDGRSIWPSGC
jgi:GAF domain-containing protein